ALFALASALRWMLHRRLQMPGERYRGALPPESGEQRRLRGELEQDLDHLAGEIGPRCVERYHAYERARAWIGERLRAAGWQPVEQVYASRGGHAVANIIAERRGHLRPERILIIGAHYDTIEVSPGANDNGTGVAALLALARRLPTDPAVTLRLVAYANEEPPAFQTEDMGSLVHARSCRSAGEQVVGVLVLETLGCFSQRRGSQRFPIPALRHLYGDRGDFVAFVGTTQSGSFVRRCVERFRAHARIPGEGACLPAALPGAGWSDHWAYARVGYAACMLTDTAPFRYPHYHTPADTVDKIDFRRLALVVAGVAAAVHDLLLQAAAGHQTAAKLK
ncbi:MAG: M28 family peptidase, partial [Planctomycetota bacterium]